ncbi:hypothetical protein SAMN05661044_00906 [Olivibacter domesticus]|uniref:Uncharacterized protein n=1 Tax=Olivibacter domesticus TaxID=407022 RepID=A0A1H7J7I9_OLID1|nr:hypothetical protein SAMN05661044_00906 [Olivibacter domesticus]
MIEVNLTTKIEKSTIFTKTPKGKWYLEYAFKIIIWQILLNNET